MKERKKCRMEGCDRKAVKDGDSCSKAHTRFGHIKDRYAKGEKQNADFGIRPVKCEPRPCGCQAADPSHCAAVKYCVRVNEAAARGWRCSCLCHIPDDDEDYECL